MGCKEHVCLNSLIRQGTPCCFYLEGSTWQPSVLPSCALGMRYRDALAWYTGTLNVPEYCQLAHSTEMYQTRGKMICPAQSHYTLSEIFSLDVEVARVRGLELSILRSEIHNTNLAFRPTTGSRSTFRHGAPAILPSLGRTS